MRKILITYLLFLILFINPISSEEHIKSDFEWIRTARIFLLDAYYYPLWPNIEFDAEKLAETMLDMNANAVRIATSGFYFLIPGTKFETAHDLGKRDILEECIKACKPKGIRVIAYIRTGGPLASEIVKPEWAHRVNPHGDIHKMWHMAHEMTAVCWNTSYKEAYFELIEKVVRQYDVDAIYFDSLFPLYQFSTQKGYKVCYCSGCRNEFKETTGLDIPYKENPNDYTPEDLKIFERYQEWYKEKFANIFLEIKKLITSYKDIPLIYNINHASRIKNEDPRILNGCDAFLYERGRSLLERVEGVSLAVSHGLAVWPYINFVDGWFRVNHSKYKPQQQIYATVAFGGAPIVSQVYHLVDDVESRKPIKEAFSTLEQNKQYIEKFHPEIFCAVVWNDDDPPGRPVSDYVWETNARKSSLGAFAICMYNHIQATSFLKEDLGNPELLNQYKVLYLPDICYLSEKQIMNIENFVKKGGGLVMSYGTSLYEENGKRRSDFSLGKLAKVKYINPDEKLSVKINRTLGFGGVWDLYVKPRPGQKIIKSPLADGLIPAFLYEPVEVLPEGSIAADLVIGTNTEPIFPGLIVANYGKGKVAYISSEMGSIYLQSNIQQFADFMKDVIEYVSPDCLPYEIEAPSTLFANMTSKGNTKVLHLVNWTGCNLERLENIQLEAYYIPPVENVKIKFNIPNGKKINEVKLFIPAEFEQYIDKNSLYITLHKVDKYQGVIIEMD